MSGNKSLHKANKEKNDEFYTQLADIENELKHYKKHFKDKTILCNCDDPYESNFFKYFAMNFNTFGLKKLIATCYAESSLLSMFNMVEGEKQRNAYKIEITEIIDENGDGAIDLADVESLIRNRKNTLTRLEGDGDFRSAECIELLKESDIVVTNPPFSLFREYVAQLMGYEKKFIIIGNQNAITYKETFNLIKDNKIWLGYYSGDMAFTVPDYYEERETRFWIDENGQKWRSMGNICWFTNIETAKRDEELILYKKFSPEEYPKYDNSNIINVNKVSDIPFDYDGIMGVPITFMDKYNPKQFEILGIANSARYIGYECYTLLSGKKIYNRILIRRKK